MTTLFIALTVLSVIAALHPFITYPLSLALLAKWGKLSPSRAASTLSTGAMPTPRASPRIAICLCVHNEENVIEARMRNLIVLADTVENTEILVYTDGSTDNTVSVLGQFADRIDLVVSNERHGKTHGMNLLVAKTRADLLIFTDAAVRMNADALPNMMRHFSDPSVGCVCGHIIAVDGGSDSSQSVTTETSIKYWAFDATIRRLETQVASVIGAHGPLFAIRRELHEKPPVELFDDFYVSLAILYGGHRVVQADDFCGYKAVASRHQDEYQRKIRIACQSYNCHQLMAPRLRKQSRLIRYCYASHKTLRWCTIFSLAAAALFGAAALVSAGQTLWLLYATAAGAAGVALGFAGIKPFSAGLEAVSALYANGIGVIQSLNGKSYQTWAPAKSARNPS